MFTLVSILFLLPGLSDKTASITAASSEMSKVENLILKTSTSQTALSNSAGNIVTFSLQNTGTEKLWNFDKFSLILTYTDSNPAVVTTLLTRDTNCPAGNPSSNKWCMVSISSDTVDTNILNTNEVLNGKINVSPSVSSGTMTLVISTDNGITATRTVSVP
jgi:hypothetical protein